MKPIKILHLAPPGFGGIDAYIFSHYKYMDQKKFQFDFLTQNADLASAEQYKEFSYRVWPLTMTAGQDKGAFAKHIRNVLGHGYDILHLHTSYWTGFLIEELAKEAGIKKVIVHAHSTYVDEPDDGKRAQLLHRHEEIKAAFSPELATDYWACSQTAADWLFGPQISREKIRIMKNAIEIEKFRFDLQKRDHVRNRLGLGDALVLGTTGRFSYQKNQAFMIDVFAEFRQRHRNSKLLIIGDGELRGELEKQIADRRLEKDIILLGWMIDVEKYMQAMDVFLMPSRFEGLGIAAVEAAASGLPCLVSDRMPGDVDVSQNVRHMPLNVLDWIDSLEGMIQKDIDRQQGAEIVRTAGYDVRQQAKVLESLYRE